MDRETVSEFTVSPTVYTVSRTVLYVRHPPQNRPQSFRFSLMMMSVTASNTNLTFSVSVAHVMWE